MPIKWSVSCSLNESNFKGNGDALSWKKMLIRKARNFFFKNTLKSYHKNTTLRKIHALLIRFFNFTRFHKILLKFRWIRQFLFPIGNLFDVRQSTSKKNISNLAPTHAISAISDKEVSEASPQPWMRRKKSELDKQGFSAHFLFYLLRDSG